MNEWSVCEAERARGNAIGEQGVGRERGASVERRRGRRVEIREGGGRVDGDDRGGNRDGGGGEGGKKATKSGKGRERRTEMRRGRQRGSQRGGQEICSKERVQTVARVGRK